jgi:hypothetical protein
MPPTQRSAKRLTTDRDGPLRRDETTRNDRLGCLPDTLRRGARGGKRVTKKAGKPFITKRSRTLVLAPWTRMRVRYSQPVPDALSRLCSALPFPCMSSLAGPVCFGIYGNWQPAGSGANGTGTVESIPIPPASLVRPCLRLVKFKRRARQPIGQTIEPSMGPPLIALLFFTRFVRCLAACKVYLQRSLEITVGDRVLGSVALLMVSIHGRGPQTNRQNGK